MVNTTDEITIIDAEIEKVTKEINRLSGDIRDRYRTVVDILLVPGNKGCMDIEREDLNEQRRAVESLKKRRNTLLQSREDKLNKIVFREHREEMEKQQKEVEELAQRRAELIAKYGNPETQSKTQDTASTPQTPANPTEQATLKVSFNDRDLIVTINDNEYLFAEITKKHRKKKLTEAYSLFRLLYENQHRRMKKGEIGETLNFDNNEQRVFNAKSKASKVVKCSPFEISNEKEYGDRGGYLLVVKTIDLESS